jgi:rsbT co-antagonist protein RsbR
MDQRTDHREYMTRLRLDEREIHARRAFFEITEEDLARLAALRPLAEQHTDAIVDSFYELLLAHAETRRFFPDDATIRRVKRTQREYFMGLFAGRLDAAYVEDRLRVGAAHERIGLAPKWYMGAYRRYLHLMIERLMRHFEDTTEAFEVFTSIQKLVYFDMSLAIDTYFAAGLDALRRHQAAVRELSTPVIRVHDRVLLLPLVGTVDSQRAQQIMETVLLRVIEDQAKALILDIAGVPVVDTKVADHLIKTTAAVRLIGCATILTGISAQVARTIVQLGVDISSMHTRSRLADGIELALGMVDKTITSRIR